MRQAKESLIFIAIFIVLHSVDSVRIRQNQFVLAPDGPEYTGYVGTVSRNKSRGLFNCTLDGLEENKLICDMLTDLKDLWTKEGLVVDKITTLEVNNHNRSAIGGLENLKLMPNLRILKIINTSVLNIPDEIFCNIGLENIQIDYNNIVRLNERVFYNLTLLDILSLEGNKLKFISRSAISNLPNLGILSLSYNLLDVIPDSAFEELPKLADLRLDHNLIENVYVNKILIHPTMLSVLLLNNNYIKVVNKMMLQELDQLEFLNLGSNSISIIEKETFKHTPKLKYLIISNNAIVKLDSRIFPKRGMDYIEWILLDNNKLMHLSSNFFFKLKNLQYVTLLGNPWYCNCLEYLYRIINDNDIALMCSENYFDGSQAQCVVDTSTPEICSSRYNNILSETFRLQKTGDQERCFLYYF